MCVCMCEYMDTTKVLDKQLEWRRYNIYVPKPTGNLKVHICTKAFKLILSRKRLPGVIQKSLHLNYSENLNLGLAL